MDEVSPIIYGFCAGGVVFRRRENGIEIALMKNEYGKWTFPKGHLEPGESVEHAAVRESREELGIGESLQIGESVGEFDLTFRRNGATIVNNVKYFLMEASAETILKPEKEEGITDARWFTPGEAQETIGYQNTRDILAAALAKL